MAVGVDGVAAGTVVASAAGPGEDGTGVGLNSKAGGVTGAAAGVAAPSAAPSTVALSTGGAAPTALESTVPRGGASATIGSDGPSGDGTPSAEDWTTAACPIAARAISAGTLSAGLGAPPSAVRPRVATLNDVVAFPVTNTYAPTTITTARALATAAIASRETRGNFEGASGVLCLVTGMPRVSECV